MAGLNDYVRSLHQAAYDYAWDRWGTYAGTFRTWLIVAAFVESILPPAYRLIVGSETSLLRTVVNELAVFALIWFVFVRHHLGEEWDAQKRGSYDLLNAKALRSQAGGSALRVCMAIVVGLGLVLFKNDAVMVATKVLAIGFCLSWTYACEVMVRERDPDRFARRRLAAQAG